MIYKGLLSAILLIVFPNLVNTNPNDRESDPKGVVLDVKQNSGDAFIYDKNGKVETFTPKEGYLFSEVKQGTKDVWKASDSNEYANKVVLNGKGNKEKTVTLDLVNTTTKTVHKSGKNKPWVVESTDENDGSHSFHSDRQSGCSTDYRSGSRSGAGVGSGDAQHGTFPAHGGCGHGTHAHHGNFGGHGNVPGHSAYAECMDEQLCEKKRKEMAAQKDHAGRDSFEGYGGKNSGSYYDKHGSNQPSKDRAGHGTMHSEPGGFESYDDLGTKDTHQRTLGGEGDEGVEYDQEDDEYD